MFFSLINVHNFNQQEKSTVFRSALKSVTAGVIISLSLTGVLQVAKAQSPVMDDFEADHLNLNNWSLVHMPERRHWIDTNLKRSGKAALAIRVKGYDIDKRCNCQVSEIREANNIRLKFGEEAWYAYSFRISGRGGDTVHTRWQLGGWKQETDGSPFVSQRFDNGVFHITIESGKSRVLIATAQGKADSFIAAVAKGLMSQFGYLTEKEKYDGKEDIILAYGKNPILPDPYEGWVDMMYHIKGDLNGNGIFEVFANNRFIARATGTIGVKEFEGTSQYFRFGHNRAAMPGTATLYFDNYRRAKTRAEIINNRPR